MPQASVCSGIARKRRHRIDNRQGAGARRNRGDLAHRVENTSRRLGMDDGDDVELRRCEGTLHRTPDRRRGPTRRRCRVTSAP